MPKIVIISGKSLCELLIFGIYLLIAIWLSPDGTTHLHTNNTQNDANNKRTTQITNVGECGPCPVFASFTLAFALQLRKKHGKTLSQGTGVVVFLIRYGRILRLVHFFLNRCGYSFCLQA
jgi:hypothetical protein